MFDEQINSVKMMEWNFHGDNRDLTKVNCYDDPDINPILSYIQGCLQ